MTYINIREVEFSDADISEDRKQIIRKFLLSCNVDIFYGTARLSVDRQQFLLACGAIKAKKYKVEIQLEEEIKALSPIRIALNSETAIQLKEPSFQHEENRLYLQFHRDI